ncbi:unnamed protein product, partial [Strongylus vulgaris]
DWHPENHISFISHANDSDRKIVNHPGEVTVGDTVQFEFPGNGFPSVTQASLSKYWNLTNTEGAELDKRLKLPDGHHIVQKGYDTYVDSYSAFGDNNGKPLKVLEDLLHNEGIEVVLSAGLVYEICVRHTAEDASLLGFFSAIVTDASKALTSHGIRIANEILAMRQVAVMNKKTAEGVIDHKEIPLVWITKLVENIEKEL